MDIIHLSWVVTRGKAPPALSLAGCTGAERMLQVQRAVANSLCWQSDAGTFSLPASPTGAAPRSQPALSWQTLPSRDEAFLLCFPGHFCSTSCSWQLLPKAIPFWGWTWLLRSIFHGGRQEPLQAPGCSLAWQTGQLCRKSFFQAVEPFSFWKLNPVGTNLASSD